MTYSFCKEIYPKEAIVKASYFFADDFFVTLDADDTHYQVELVAKTEVVERDEREFQNEVLAQVNRFMISQSTKHIREMIVGRALASTMIDKRDEGFVDDASMCAEDILVNWFEAQ